MPIPTSLRAPLAIACIAALGACAHRAPASRPRHEDPLGQRSAAPGRQCTPLDEPKALPPLNVMVDSTALDAALRDLRRAPSAASGYAIFSLTFDENGWNARREVVEHDLAPQLADSLQELFFEHRRSVAPGPAWGVRLRIDLAEAPRYRVGRQVFCAPRALTFPSLGGPRNAWDVGNQLITLTQQNSIWARVLVDEQGRVGEARLEHAGLGVRWESAALGLIQSMSFAPATVDGIPIARWIRMRVPIQLW